MKPDSRTSSDQSLRRGRARAAARGQSGATSRLKKPAVALALLCVMGAAGFGLEQLRRLSESGPRVGQQLPDYHLIGLGGGRVSSRELSGRKYVLVFFRAECQHCEQEFAELKKIRRELTEQLTVVAASLSSAEETRRVKQEWGVSFDVYPGGAGALAKQIGLRSVPTLALVGEDGRVRYVQQGSRRKEFQESVFRRFVEGADLSEEALRAEGVRREGF